LGATTYISYKIEVIKYYISNPAVKQKISVAYDIENSGIDAPGIF